MVATVAQRIRSPELTLFLKSEEDYEAAEARLGLRDTSTRSAGMPPRDTFFRASFQLAFFPSVSLFHSLSMRVLGF